MALEAVILQQQDPFIYAYNYKDYKYNMPSDSTFQPQILHDINGYWDSSSSAAAQNHTSSSSETCPPPTHRKRRRTKPLKNKEEMENQRMTHIAVERNRRKQMNDYLAILRSLMPPSYSQRGDQASIVGGAINFVKELEQLVQFLESHKPCPNDDNIRSDKFSSFFTFPQYSTVEAAAERRSSVADIEVMMVESHANIKISTKRRPKQLLEIVSGFQSICLTILHLNITTVDQSVLYSFSVKVEEGCQLSTVNEIATSVHDILELIQQHSSISS